MGLAWTVARALGVRIGLRNSHAILKVVRGFGVCSTGESAIEGLVEEKISSPMSMVSMGIW